MNKVSVNADPSEVVGQGSGEKKEEGAGMGTSEVQKDVRGKLEKADANALSDDDDEEDDEEVRLIDVDGMFGKYHDSSRGTWTLPRTWPARPVLTLSRNVQFCRLSFVHNLLTLYPMFVGL